MAPKQKGDDSHHAAKLKNEYLRTYVKKGTSSKSLPKMKNSTHSSEPGSTEASEENSGPGGQASSKAVLRRKDSQALLEEKSTEGTELTKKDVSKLIRRNTELRKKKLGARTCAEDRMQAILAQKEVKQEYVPVSHRTWFTSIIGLAVVANAVQLGVEVDYPQHKDAYAVLEHLFTVIFTLEMLVKLVELHKHYFKDPWNLIDFVLVWLSILDCWILVFVVGSGDGPDLRIFSMLRILRILRLLRAVRLFKVFHELWKIVKGILDSLRAVGWAAMLLIFLLYICGVFCCVIVGKNESAGYLRFEDEVEHIDGLGRDFDVYQFYGTVPRAMYTLFETCVEPLNIRPVIERQPGMVAFFFCFVFISTFGVLNVIIGVIVEHTMAVSNEKQNAEMVRVFQEKMDKLEYVRDNCFVDQDDDGDVSVEEIREAFGKPNVVDTLEEVEMPLGIQPEEFFALLDASGDGQVTHDEMLMQLTRATVHSEHQMLLDLKIAAHTTQRQIRDISSSLAKVTSSLANLQGQVKYGFCQILPEEKMQSWPTGQCLASNPNSCQDQELQKTKACESREGTSVEHRTCPAMESSAVDNTGKAKNSTEEKCLDISKIQKKVDSDYGFPEVLVAKEMSSDVDAGNTASKERPKMMVEDYSSEKSAVDLENIEERLKMIVEDPPLPAHPRPPAEASSVELSAQAPGQRPFTPQGQPPELLKIQSPSGPPKLLKFEAAAEPPPMPPRALSKEPSPPAPEAPPLPPDTEVPSKPGLHHPSEGLAIHVEPGSAVEATSLPGVPSANGAG